MVNVFSVVICFEVKNSFFIAFSTSPPILARQFNMKINIVTFIRDNEVCRDPLESTYFSIITKFL